MASRRQPDGGTGGCRTWSGGTFRPGLESDHPHQYHLRGIGVADQFFL